MVEITHSQIEEILELDPKEPIDVKAALIAHNGDKAYYSNQLEDFEAMQLNVCMKEFANSVDARDKWQVKAQAQTLQESSGSIGAGHIHFICWSLQQACISNNFVAVIELYILLVEASIEFKRFSRKVLAHFKCKLQNQQREQALFIESEHRETPSARQAYLPEGYSVLYDQGTDKFYCLKQGQLRKCAHLN